MHYNRMPLSEIMKDVKRNTTSKIAEMPVKDNNHLFLPVFNKAAECRSKQQDYKVWQDEYHPIAITSEKWLLQKMGCIHDKPVRKGFVDTLEYWKYSSARNWILDDDSIFKMNTDIIRG
jgi:putative transposase